MKRQILSSAHHIHHFPRNHMSASSAAQGQIVRHIDGGKHIAGECDRDYLSGGLKGVIMDVCGDYAQVKGTPF
jgi:hypothetical protein